MQYDLKNTKITVPSAVTNKYGLIQCQMCHTKIKVHIKPRVLITNFIAHIKVMHFKTNERKRKTIEDEDDDELASKKIQLSIKTCFKRKANLNKTDCIL